MRLNANRRCDTARVLRISTDTVLRELKKKETALESVNSAWLRTVNPDEMIVNVEQAGAAELDEMWSFVGKKATSTGCGMPLLIRGTQSWCMSLGGIKMPSFSHSQRC
jgi:hypothetical protein